MGNGGFGQYITLGYCCFFLTLFPCSSVGPIPQNTVLHKLLQRGSFLWASVPQEHTAPAYLWTKGQSSCQDKPVPVWAPLSGSQRGYFKTHPPNFSMDVSSTLVFSGCKEIPAPLWSLPKLPVVAGEYWLRHLKHLVPILPH